MDKQPTPRPTPTLSVEGFTPLVNARFGSSQADVLIFALEAYHSAKTKEAMQCLSNQEYENGHLAFEDAETAKALLLDFALNLTAAADRNYWAAHPHPTHEPNQTERYHQFLANYLPGLNKSETSNPDQQ